MFAEKKKRVTGNGASHHAVQPSSSEVVPPVAPFDRERLYDRLVKSVHMAPRFQENAVITMLQELHDGSRGLVRVLLARPRAESGGASSTPSYTSAIHWNGRLYGFLLIASDPTQPTRPCLPLEAASGLALTCAVLFYSLEVSALLHGDGQTADMEDGTLTRR